METALALPDGRGHPPAKRVHVQAGQNGGSPKSARLPNDALNLQISSEETIEEGLRQGERNDEVERTVPALTNSSLPNVYEVDRKLLLLAAGSLSQRNNAIGDVQTPNAVVLELSKTSADIITKGDDVSVIVFCCDGVYVEFDFHAKVLQEFNGHLAFMPSGLTVFGQIKEKTHWLDAPFVDIDRITITPCVTGSVIVECSMRPSDYLRNFLENVNCPMSESEKEIGFCFKIDCSDGGEKLQECVNRRHSRFAFSAQPESIVHGPMEAGASSPNIRKHPDEQMAEATSLSQRNNAIGDVQTPNAVVLELTKTSADTITTYDDESVMVFCCDGVYVEFEFHIKVLQEFEGHLALMPSGLTVFGEIKEKTHWLDAPFADIDRITIDPCVTGSVIVECSMRPSDCLRNFLENVNCPMSESEKEIGFCFKIDCPDGGEKLQECVNRRHSRFAFSAQPESIVHGPMEAGSSSPNIRNHPDEQMAEATPVSSEDQTVTVTNRY